MQLSFVLFKMLLILIRTFPVITIEESMCIGTGYFWFNKTGTTQTKFEGYRSPGWDKFSFQHSTSDLYYAEHIIWGANHFRPEYDPKPSVKLSIHAVKSPTDDMDVDGWLIVSVVSTLSHPPRLFAVWATTDTNEAYGQFVRNVGDYSQCTLDLAINKEKYEKSYVPCSAAPVNSPTIPNVFRFLDKGSNYSTPQTISLMWLADMSYCNRPEKFRFIIASAKDNWYEDMGWNPAYSNADPASLSLINDNDQRNSAFGPHLVTSPWIYPKFYGMASNIPYRAFKCDAKTDITSAKPGWITQTVEEPLDLNVWYSNRWDIDSSSADVVEYEDAMKRRATCKGARTGQSDFVGRCTKAVNPKQPDFVFGDKTKIMECTHQNSHVGQSEFNDEYEQNLQTIETSRGPDGNCVCPALDHISGRRKRSMRKSDGGNSRTNMKRPFINDPYADFYHSCTIPKPTIPLQVKRGVCLFTVSGRLVFGVRQWHGCTSLFVTLILTPVSIYVARYFKSHFMLSPDGKIPYKPWYLVHIMLLLPTIWMHASGFAALSRQTDLLGVSLSDMGVFHRTAGWLVFFVMGVQCITGIFRPINKAWRDIVILLHSIGGFTQHGLELFLSFSSSQIPSSPSSGKSHMDPHFQESTQARSAKLVAIWSGFMFVCHIFLTIRIRIWDIRHGIPRRPVCPIIIPILPVRQDDVDYVEQDLWFHKGVLTFILLISVIIYIVSMISFYQRLDPYILTYGFGPMTCSHSSKTKLSAAGCS